MLVSSRDLVARWKERPGTLGLRFYFNEQLGGGSWLIGRVTGSKHAKAEAYLDRGPPPGWHPLHLCW